MLPTNNQRLFRFSYVRNVGLFCLWPVEFTSGRSEASHLYSDRDSGLANETGEARPPGALGSRLTYTATLSQLRNKVKWKESER